MLRSPRRRQRSAEHSQIDRDALRQLRRVGGFIRPYRRYLLVALVGVVIASALGLVYPLVLGDLVDRAVQPASVPGDINRVALGLLGLFAGQAGFNAIRIYFLNVMGEGIVADLRKATYAHLMMLPVKFFDDRKTGEITSRLTSDIAVLQATVSTSLAQALAQGMTFIGGVVLMFLVSVRLSVTVMSFLPLAIVAAAFFGRRLRRISTEFQDRVADASAYAEEAIAANRVVKWFTAEAREVERYNAAIEASYQVARRRARLEAVFTPVVTFVGFGTLAVVFWVGGRQVLAGRMSAGDLVTFLLYTITVAGAIGTFTGLYSQLQASLGASQRIFELLDERSDVVEPVTPAELTAFQGRVTFDGVSFAYDDRRLEVLAGITLDARPGETIALVGPSGSGKSTMVQLIPRFFDPSDGVVRVDGVDAATLRLFDLRRHMAAVPQETQLFSGTIADNLRVGKRDATDAELAAAAGAANADEFIAKFPAGFETVVGERGVKLSGGQRQRVAIARALLKDPKVLILDEATSSLDSESEALVQEALDRLMQGRTTFVIAHRLSTVRNADRIVVIDQGRIVDEGTHDALMERGGLYAELYARQFEDDALI